MLFWDEPSQVCLSLGYFLISVHTFSVLQVLHDKLTKVMHLHLFTSIYIWLEGEFSFTFSTSEFHYFVYSAQVVRLRPSFDSLWEVICMWKVKKCIHFYLSYLNRVSKVLLGQGLYVTSFSSLSQVDQRQKGTEKWWTTSVQESKVAAQRLQRVWQQIHDLAPAQAWEAMNLFCSQWKALLPQQKSAIVFVCRGE